VDKQGERITGRVSECLGKIQWWSEQLDAHYFAAQASFVVGAASSAIRGRQNVRRRHEDVEDWGTRNQDVNTRLTRIAVLNTRHVHPRLRRPIRTSTWRSDRYGVIGGRDEEGGRGGEE
jgi:hypothetical protein